MSISTTRKSPNEHGFFIVVTFLGKIGEERIRDLTGDVLFPWPSKAPYPLWPWRTRGITGASYPIRPWRASATARIFLAHGQEFWHPKCAPIEQADWSKYSPMNLAKTLEPALSIWPEPVRNKNPKVKILRSQKQEILSTNAMLKSWTPDADLMDAGIENMDPNAVWC